jgi:hypothetical protein
MIAPSQAESDGAARARAANSSSASDANGSLPNPFDPFLKNITELREYLQDYLAARKDKAIASTRRLMVSIAAGLAAGVIGLTSLAVCVVMFLLGLAGAFSAATGTSLWVSQIVIGGGVILIAVTIASVVTVFWLRSGRKQTISKYESLHRAQRAKLGRDVAQRAASPR